MRRDDRPRDPMDPQRFADVLSRIDPVPEGLLAQLGETFESRHPDTELARLVTDVAVDVGRAGDPAQEFGFESVHCALNARFSPSHNGPPGSLELSGTVERTTPVTLLIETPQRTTTGVVDGQSISADGLGHGPARLYLAMRGPDEPWLLETEWITL